MTSGSNIQRALDHQAKLEAEATPGPWVYFDNGFDGGLVEGASIRDSPDGYYRQSSGPFVLGGEPHEGRAEEDDPNVRLIAHLRNQAKLARAVIEAAATARATKEPVLTNYVILDAKLAAWADHVNGESVGKAPTT